MGAVNRGDELLSSRTSAGRWEVDYPFEWDADELVSRRQLLRWSVGASGALFAGTAVLAALAFARSRARGGPRAIVASSAIPIGGAHYFTYPGPEDHAILLRLDATRFVAFSGKCTHLSCAVYWNAEMGKLRCPCHEGLFDAATGSVLAGPPQRPLPRIELREQDGMLYAVRETPQ
jgi:Rieske Fe-S protein